MQIKFYKGAPSLRARCFFYAEKEDGGIVTAMLTVRQRKNVVAKSAADGGRRWAAGRGGWQAGGEYATYHFSPKPALRGG